MRYRSSMGLLLALAAGGGCTSLVGLDGVSFTGAGGSGGSGGGSGGSTSSSGGGGSTMTSSTSTGGGGSTMTSSTSTGGGGSETTSSTSTGGSTGTTTMTPTAICGDGDVDDPEQCDDGDSTNGDGCSAQCLVEPFHQCQGSPSICTKHEVLCDDGADNDGDGNADFADLDCAVPGTFSGCANGDKLHVYKAVDVPAPIPNDSGSGVDSLIFVGDSPTIIRAVVVLTVTHPEDKDLAADLTPPSGSKIDLFTQVGGGGESFVSTVLDSACGSGIGFGSAPFSGCYKPQDSLAPLANTNANGAWELHIEDDSDPYSGTLDSWMLILCVD